MLNEVKHLGREREVNLATEGTRDGGILHSAALRSGWHPRSGVRRVRPGRSAPKPAAEALLKGPPRLLWSRFFSSFCPPFRDRVTFESQRSETRCEAPALGNPINKNAFILNDLLI